MLFIMFLFVIINRELSVLMRYNWSTELSHLKED